MTNIEEPKRGYITRWVTTVEPTTQEAREQMSDAVTEQESAADLEARLKAIRDQEAADKVEKVSAPILDQIDAAEGDSFIHKLRQVATDLKEAGQLGEEQVLAAGEEGTITATLIKLLGEIVVKVKG